MPEHHDEFHTLTKPYGPCAPTCPHPDHQQTTTEQAALTDLERRILEDGWVEQDFTGIRLAVERIVAERIAEALRDAADAALTMYDPPVEECIRWSEWLRARADYRRIRRGGDSDA